MDPRPPESVSTAGTTFVVSPVLPAADPLPEVPYVEAIERLLLPQDLLRRLEEPEPREWPGHDPAAVEHSLRAGFPGDPAFAAHIQRILADGRAAGEQNRRAERDALLAERRRALGHPIEAASGYRGTLVESVAMHPLVAALHLGFAGHRPVSLSPDAVWLTLCQGVAHHLRADPEAARSRLGLLPGRAVLEVRRDDFVKGSPENPWPEVFEELAAAARRHAGLARGFFGAEFSTTGSAERAVRDVLLLGALEPFCSYSLRTLCGIPSLTLEGTPDDWRRVAEGARRFAALGLEWWVTPLAPVLEQFVAAAEGRVAGEFWRSLYKYNDESGRHDVQGWVALFFPYLKGDGDGLPAARNDVVEDAYDKVRAAGAGRALDWRGLCAVLAGRGTRDPEEDEEAALWLQQVLFPDEEDHGFNGIGTGRFPGGLVRVPFTWHYLRADYAMEFLGGLVGVRQDRETLGLRPEVGWAVRQAGPAGE